MKNSPTDKRLWALLFSGLLAGAALLAEPADEADFLTEDDLFDEPIEGMVTIADPLEPLNRFFSASTMFFIARRLIHWLVFTAM